jgi:ABC-2 type transport system ATP-binding protein
MIEVKNLVKHYGPTKAVDGISFRVEKGEIVGFLGPNGAGKTTTMKMMTCYIPQDSGEISLAGLDTRTDSLSIREKVGYLPENTPLYNEMRVDEYLAFVAGVRKIANPDKRIEEVIRITPLEGVFKKYIEELSKGYRQRVGLAQALIHDPEILILDEPTSGLDPNQIIGIRKLIRELGKNKTIILSTHILQEVSAVCDRVLIIHEGKIVADDSPSDLQNALAGETEISLTCNADESALQQQLSALPILSIRMLGSKDGWHSYLLKTKPMEEISEKIFDAAVAGNWRIRELRKETISLENVFLKLTSSSGENRT